MSIAQSVRLVHCTVYIYLGHDTREVMYAELHEHSDRPDLKLGLGFVL